MKNCQKVLGLLLIVASVLTACQGSGAEPSVSDTTSEVPAETQAAEVTEEISESNDEIISGANETIPATPSPTEIKRMEDPGLPSYEGYTLLWFDEFDENELDKRWNIQQHPPGHVNNELQQYCDCSENVYLEDGHLVLRATKELDEDGEPYYYSGKVDNRNSCAPLYGKVVVSAKIPEGQGLWPAIWMMPYNESRYGSWPTCGEIDIMEILCNDPATTYSTIHYGLPHEQQQGVYSLPEGTFADDFHEYILEWEPGEMRFYIDDVNIFTVNDWFCSAPSSKFPAPFNQKFYLQLNLAVGGDWPGNPDETTDFTNAAFEVDYVRIYTLDEYDENVVRPSEDISDAREPDSDGNYIYNGNLDTSCEMLNDTTASDSNIGWGFLTAENGIGQASITDGVIRVTTEQAGNQEYSIQLINPNIPLIKGNTYTLTFKAHADSERIGVVCVTGPDRDYVRYLEDECFEVGTEDNLYTYTFTMNEETDLNGRLEFNLGATDSVSDVYITEVKLFGE